MLRAVPIDSVWDRLEPAMRAVLCDPTQNSPEEIRALCLDGNAVCFECNDGYIVARIRIHPRTHRSELHCNFAVSEAVTPGAFERTLPDMIALARRMDCSNVVFNTQREGWLRKASRAGFRARDIELEYAL